MRDKVTMAGCDTSRAGVNSRRQPQSAGIGRATTARSVGLTLPAAIVRGIVVIAALVTGLAAPDSLCAAARSSPSKWNTDGKFEAALDRPISAIWSGVSLRRIVQRIITDRNIAILIDRRVDPDQFLKVDSDNIPLVELLRRLAEQTRSGFRITGNVAYIGPEHAAAKLRTLIHLRRTETRRQTVDRSRRRGLLQRRTINWNDLDEALPLLRETAAKFDLELEGGERVPHDLWRGAALPSVDAIEALSLLLVQFNLTFEWSPSARGIRLVSIPDRVVVERRHRPVGRAAADVAGEIRDRTDARITVDGRQLIVRGLVEDHEFIERFLNPKRVGAARPTSGPVPLSRRTFTLEIRDVPASALLHRLTKSGIMIDYDAEALKQAGVDLEKPITMNVTRIPADRFFKLIGDQLGVTSTIDGLAVTLKPARQ